MSTVSGVTAAFATPIYRRLWPDSEALNAELLSMIDAKRADQPEGVDRALRGGWHSDLDLFEWGGACVSELADRVFAGFQAVTQATVSDARSVSGQMEMSGWANVTRRGGYHRVHNHAESVWSGAYYVHVGESDADCPESGTLELLDPRPSSNMIGTPGNPFGGNRRFSPEPGLLIMFPSWLQHFVNPYRGSGRRVSIAFNVSLG